MGWLMGAADCAASPRRDRCRASLPSCRTCVCMPIWSAPVCAARAHTLRCRYMGPKQTTMQEPPPALIVLPPWPHKLQTLCPLQVHGPEAAAPAGRRLLRDCGRVCAGVFFRSEAILCLWRAPSHLVCVPCSSSPVSSPAGRMLHARSMAHSSGTRLTALACVLVCRR